MLEKISYNPGFEISEKTVDYPDRLMRTVRVRQKAHQTFRFTKLAIISVDQKIEDQLLAIPYEKHYRLHRENFKKKFDNANILVEGDELAQLGISYSIYHLLILSPNHRQSASIPARGLSGQVYKGAVFWDTEIFMFPFFALTAPEIAKTLLKYRIDSLPKAKEKAKEFGCLGAYYPWESIENGKRPARFQRYGCFYEPTSPHVFQRQTDSYQQCGRLCLGPLFPVYLRRILPNRRCHVGLL